MVKVLEDRIKVLESIKTKVTEIAMEEAIKHRKFIQEANRRQLQEGKRADNSSLPNYVQNSKSPSAPGVIKLFDTGDFYQGIEPLFDEEGIEMIGVDSKTGLLTGKYGKLILGLNEKNIAELSKRMLPGIRAKVLSILT